MRRRTLAEQGARLMESEGFDSVHADELRAFFDVIAEKRGSIHVIKFMENIDALSAGEAAALRKLGAFLDGRALVVGKCKGRDLRRGVEFTRHGVACISVESMEEALHGRITRRARRFFSECRAIDGPELQRLRKLYGLSMRVLGTRTGVSAASIYRYESGNEDITSGNLDKLEGFFMRGLGRDVEGTAEEPAKYSAFMNTGMQGIRLDRDPFASAAKGRARYEVGAVADYRTMKKRAMLYRALNGMLGDYPFFVTGRKTHRRAIHGVPIVTKKELAGTRGEAELRELICESAEY